MADKKKKVWFWGDNDGGGGTGKDAEDDMAGHLSRDETMSQYSHSKGLLPSLGATARSSLRPFIISPFDPRYRFLSSLLLCFHYLFLFICLETRQDQTMNACSFYIRLHGYLCHVVKTRDS